MAMHPRLDKRLKRLGAMGASSGAERSNAPSGLRMAIGFVILAVVASPFVVLMVLAALAGVGAVLWLSFFTVFLSLLLGLGFLSWAFG
jgi:hypothetical protein